MTDSESESIKPCASELYDMKLFVAAYLAQNIITDEGDLEWFLGIAKQYIKERDEIINEADRMYEDRRYDHDNYDSINRETNLRQMKDHLKYLENRAEEVLAENYNIKVKIPIFTIQ